MKDVLVGTKLKDSFTDISANMQTKSNHPLHLEANHNYELAMVSRETYYSFANIRGVSNTFKGSVDDGTALTTLHIPTDCYAECYKCRNYTHTWRQ